VTKDNLDVKIDGDQLAIHGKRPASGEKGTFLIREIPEGDFYQSYTIDDTIDRNKIDAALEKGILALTLHLKESEKPRKINVVAK
jgi:HSP20 family protein